MITSGQNQNSDLSHRSDEDIEAIKAHIEAQGGTVLAVGPFKDTIGR